MIISFKLDGIDPNVLRGFAKDLRDTLYVTRTEYINAAGIYNSIRLYIDEVHYIDDMPVFYSWEENQTL